MSKLEKMTEYDYLETKPCIEGAQIMTKNVLISKYIEVLNHQWIPYCT